jgi:hypothetical protein
MQIMFRSLITAASLALAPLGLLAGEPTPASVEHISSRTNGRPVKLGEDGVIAIKATATSGTTLTGILNDQCDPDGNSLVTNYWNTYAGDFIWNLFVTVNSGAAGPFINGPDDINAGPISVDLSAPGTYTIVVYAASPGVFGGTPRIDHSSLNLFFNGDHATPRISAKTPADTNAAFSVNSATSLTQALAPTEFPGLIPAAGTLSFVDGPNLITLIDYRWYNPEESDAELPVGDRVGTIAVEQDGGSDMRGLFTLRVTPLPSLSIVRVTSNSAKVFWPSPASGFSLYETSNLISPNWTLISSPPVDDGSNKSVIIDLSPGSRFFRLMIP